MYLKCAFTSRFRLKSSFLSTSQAMLESLADKAACSVEQLPARLDTLAVLERRSLGSERNACRLREDLTEATQKEFISLQML